MKANEIITCSECGKTSCAAMHVGCDVEGFGGHLQQCACCGEYYYVQSNNAVWNSPCCYPCHEANDKGWLSDSEQERYNKAMR